MSYSRLTQAIHKIRARWKYLLSFTKKNWQLSDYPILFHKQNTESFTGPERLRPIPWTATIVNWCITGSGDTKQASFDSLQTHFESFQATGKPLPRPGTHIPIEFASDEKVSRFPSLRDDFIHQILDLEWAFLSDESSLWHFHELESNDELNKRILNTYGVDVSDIANGNITDILEPVHDLLSRRTRKARWTNCKLVLSFRSQFFHSLRHFSSHPKDLSTTQRLGKTTKVCSSLRWTT
jgi:hypothetical protein